MVKKQKSKDYCRAYRHKKGDLCKAIDAARKKRLKEKEENI